MVDMPVLGTGALHKACEFESSRRHYGLTKFD